MYVSEKRNKVTVADAVDFERRKVPPSKDLPYWAGSAERAKERTASSRRRWTGTRYSARGTARKTVRTAWWRWSDGEQA